MATATNDVFSAIDLGTIAEKLVYGVTLNFSPMLQVKSPIGKGKIAWGILTPYQQRKYYENYIKEIYVHLADRIYGTYELTSKGELHAHLMMIVNDNIETKEYWLQMIRKQVMQHSTVLRLFKGKRHTIITANYIHGVDYQEWIEYMLKDIRKTPFGIQTWVGGGA